MNPVSVIYILSNGHGGSTLLDLLLGSHSEIEGVGEIFRLVDKLGNSSHDTLQCTCRAKVVECNFWSNVIARMKRDPADGTKFEDKNYPLFSAIRETTEKKYICDSSKKRGLLDNFLASNLFDILIIHLVRDGRAVGYSRTRKNDRIYHDPTANKHIGKLRMGEYYPTLARWCVKNIWYVLRYGWRRNYVRVRYEDLVRDPRTVLSRILTKIDLRFEEAQLQFYERDRHNIGGNRMRLSVKGIVLDTEYLSALSVIRWVIGTALGFFGLLLFRYPIWHRAER